MRGVEEEWGCSGDLKGFVVKGTCVLDTTWAEDLGESARPLNFDGDWDA